MSASEADPPPAVAAPPEADTSSLETVSPPYQQVEVDRPAERPPVNTSLPPAPPMERSASDDMRTECEDLKEAAEQNLNVIVDIDSNGNIRWTSPSWEDVIGSSISDIQDMPLSGALGIDQAIFDSAIERMRTDDSRSQIIRFPITLGSLSKIAKRRMDAFEQQMQSYTDELRPPDAPEGPDLGLLLEAQGIMVVDRAAETENHTMWMLRPAKIRKVSLGLPNIVAESLGVGAEILAQYLNRIAENGGAASGTEIKPPPPVLCRICERQIPPWWFEKHTDLCYQEHKAEMDVQIAHENLNEHRNSIVKVLDALDTQNRPTRSLFGPLSDQPVCPISSPAEYKGYPIGPLSTPASNPSSGRASPSISRSRERPSTSFGHQRGRSFAIRRPVVRIVELVLDLCDTALEINTPALKEGGNDLDGEPRTQSPQSENRATQVLQWQSPSSGSGGDYDQGLLMLCEDTERFARAKVDAVVRFRRILEYSERIRVEFSVTVQDCVETAIHKATQIAAGESPSSSDCDSDVSTELESTRSPDEPSSPNPGSVIPQSPSFASDKVISTPIRMLRQSSLAMSIKNCSDSSFLDPLRPSSTRSSSPRPGPSQTPRPHNAPGAPTHSKRTSMLCEPDTGTESDTSVHSSVLSQNWRTDSPAELAPAPKLTTSRDRKRRSFMLSSVMSSRQQSPARMSAGPPHSPSRLHRVRNSEMQSPLTSPILPSGSTDFSSPAPSVQSQAQPPSLSHSHSHSLHHRRQSSAASSEITRPSVSPRLLPVMSNQQPRASPPSIKDFEIIKPISKGAFGSVYLSKKKTTGDYFAIKVLKKADMVAKNQVTNVKAERAIMMWQGESDFVAKLYWTFASKDYLYLVMEYLNGGDLASLIKVLGGLPEDWARKYLAEIVLGVEHLHSRGIVHRDLKPDNLLVDQQGHLKLTDFGLSRMGMIGRQKRALQAKTDEPVPDLLKSEPFHRTASIVQLRSSSFDFHSSRSPMQTPSSMPTLVQDGSNLSSYFPPPPPLPAPRPEPSSHSLLRRTSSIHRSDSEHSETMPFSLRNLWPDDALLPPPLQPTPPSRASAVSVEPDSLSGETTQPDGLASLPHPSISRQNTIDSVAIVDSTQCSTPTSSTMPPPPMPLFDPDDNSNRRFVGTPDYLAPETVNGDAQDELSDWWSIGCILFELLYGYPPFHADTPEEVFQNILARNIEWPDESESPVSDEAMDLMNRLLCMDPGSRLGANIEDRYSSGGAEIKAHSWFSSLNWDTVLQDEASFVPTPADPEDTEYFDSRGACDQNFASEFEDQTKPVVDGTSSEYSRPYDALSSKPRSIGPAPKRGLVPLHIPPHVRESRSRRLSETMAGDDFGSFSYKNLPVLEKANKDVIQKLRAEAMQTGTKTPSVIGSPIQASAPSLEASPIMTNPGKRTLSTNRMVNRPSSPMFTHANSSPSRTSQPSSPMVMSSFSSAQNAIRKASTCSSGSTSQVFHPPATSEGSSSGSGSRSCHKSTLSTGSSPIRIVTKTQNMPLSAVMDRCMPLSRATSMITADGAQSPRASQACSSSVDGRTKEGQSPSSSDSEESRQKALLRVQRRRQSSRRLSHITGFDGPVFRSLDVLVCDDHPVSRWVLEKLLEKLRCRTISVATGSDAVRYAMSDVKFDIILLEYKLPQVNGTEVARMIRTTKNSNSQTPLVAVTGYLNALQSMSHFDDLIEKPPTLQKMSDILSRNCNWKPAPSNGPQQPTLNLSGRQDGARLTDSPISSFGGSQHAGSTSYCASSRGEATDCSLVDPDGRLEENPTSNQCNRHTPSDSRDQDRDLARAFYGLGIHQESEPPLSDCGTDSGKDSCTWRSVTSSTDLSTVTTPQSKSSPGPEFHVRKMSDLHSSRRRFLDRTNSTGLATDESSPGSDEDDDAASCAVIPFRPHARTANRLRGTSKLGVEMMRTNSRGSIVSVGEPDDGSVAARRDSVDSTASANTLSLRPDPPDGDVNDTVITHPWPPKFAIPPSDRGRPMDGLWTSQRSPTLGKPFFPMDSFFAPPPPPPAASSQTESQFQPQLSSQPPLPASSSDAPSHPDLGSQPPPLQLPPVVIPSAVNSAPLAPIQDDSGPESDSAATPRPMSLTPVRDTLAQPGDRPVPALSLIDSDRTPRPGSRTR